LDRILSRKQNPDRLTYPVRRRGPKGSGRWERISWDEALDAISEKIIHYQTAFRAESIVLGYGTGRENEVACKQENRAPDGIELITVLVQGILGTACNNGPSRSSSDLRGSKKVFLGLVVISAPPLEKGGLGGILCFRVPPGDIRV
jgi:anaerobic selenocysteine-containing dehydrogenase